MATRIYINMEALEERRSEGNRRKLLPELDPFRFSEELPSKRWFVILNDPREAVLPEVLEDLVEEVTLMRDKPLPVPREQGIYYFRTVKAELDGDNLFIRGKNLKDVADFYHGLLIGTVGRPDESYEGAQSGPSKVELEEKLRVLEERIGYMGQDLLEATARRVDLFHAKCIADDKRRMLRALAGNLLHGIWPFCRKSTVAKAIIAALA